MYFDTFAMIIGNVFGGFQRCYIHEKNVPILYTKMSFVLLVVRSGGYYRGS